MAREHEGMQIGSLRHVEAQNVSLAEKAYLELRSRIVSLDFPPGSLIREEELMNELEMSRTPIREALLRLSLERLVVAVSRRGTFVSEVHVGSIGLLYEFRRPLEGQAAAWAAQRRRPDDLKEIESLIDAMKADSESTRSVDRDARDQMPLDQQMHFLIYRLSGNDFAEETLRTYYFLSARVWAVVSGRVTMKEAFDLPIQLLSAIANGNANDAYELAVKHNDHAENALRQAV